MRSTPVYIQFYPTLRCNKACAFCFSKNIPSVPDMPLGKFRTMLGILKTACVGTIDIMGGEPTLHSDIVSMVRESEESGIGVNISSNGTVLDVLGRIMGKTERTTIGISINDRDGLDHAREFIARRHPVVKSVYHPDIERSIITEILSLRPKKFYLLYRDAMSPEELNDPVPFDLFLASVKDKFGETAGTVFCSGFLPDTGAYPDLAGVRCPAGTTKLGVLPDGSVYPCNLFFGIDRFRLGNVFSDPFAAIWEHPALVFFRTFTKNACPRISCELHSLCHGGCPAHGLLHHGDLAAPDPRCARLNAMHADAAA